MSTIIGKISLKSRVFKDAFHKAVTTLLAVLSLLLFFVNIFVDFNNKTITVVIMISIFCVFFATFLGIVIWLNKKLERKININDTELFIRTGDIFEFQGLKVIPFNEFFDTQVDDKIIAKSSLNGKYILKNKDSIIKIENALESNNHITEKILEKNVTRPNGGNTTKYELGTICPVDDYLLLAFTHFDKDNRAQIIPKEYILCLLNMWEEIDIYYAGKSIGIPLIGYGLARLKDSGVSPQELLWYILTSFKASKKVFKNPSSITIILSKDVMDKINIYDINIE